MEGVDRGIGSLVEWHNRSHLFSFVFSFNCVNLNGESFMDTVYITMTREDGEVLDKIAVMVDYSTLHSNPTIREHLLSTAIREVIETEFDTEG